MISRPPVTKCSNQHLIPIPAQQITSFSFMMYFLSSCDLSTCISCQNIVRWATTLLFSPQSTTLDFLTLINLPSRLAGVSIRWLQVIEVKAFGEADQARQIHDGAKNLPSDFFAQRSGVSYGCFCSSAYHWKSIEFVFRQQRKRLLYQLKFRKRISPGPVSHNFDPASFPSWQSDLVKANPSKTREASSHLSAERFRRKGYLIMRHREEKQSEGKPQTTRTKYPQITIEW